MKNKVEENLYWLPPQVRYLLRPKTTIKWDHPFPCLQAQQNYYPINPKHHKQNLKWERKKEIRDEKKIRADTFPNLYLIKTFFY
jgi:hypothetical protein